MISNQGNVWGILTHGSGEMFYVPWFMHMTKFHGEFGDYTATAVASSGKLSNRYVQEAY